MSRRRGRRSVVLAALALTLTLSAVGATFALLNRDFSGAAGAVSYLAFPLVGSLIALKRPGNRVGLVFLLNGVFQGLNEFGLEFARYGLAHGHGADFLVHLGAWLNGWTWLPGLAVGVVYTTLLFPDGRPLSPRRAWVGTLAGVALSAFCAAVAIGGWQLPTPLLLQQQQPRMVGWRAIAFDVGSVSLLVVACCGLIAVVSLVLRFVRSRDIERQQLKLVAAAGVAVIGLEVVAAVDYRLQAASELVGFSLLAMPAGVAILRYRLYDIDRVVSRTVSYTLVTGLLVVVYVGLVAGIQALVPVQSSLAVAASTLTLAALFQPVRHRVQRAVDHRFNRARDDAERTIDAFARDLREDVDLASVRHRLLGVVHGTVQPAQVSLWVAS